MTEGGSAVGTGGADDLAQRRELRVAAGDRLVARIDGATDERVTRMPRVDVQVQMGDRVAVELVVDPHRRTSSATARAVVIASAKNARCSRSGN